MKNLLTRILLASTMLIVTTVSITSCNKKPETSNHQLSWDQTGNDSIVKVQSYDDHGNLLQYYMAYTMFNHLFSSGGYGAVNNYYTNNRVALDNQYAGYNNSYKYRKTSTLVPHSTSTTNTTYKSSSPVRSNNNYKSSSPARSKAVTTTTYKSSSPARTKPTASKSYSSYSNSSPARSTSSSSYKSSSSSSSYRSSSSPSRSSSSSSSSSYRSSSPSRSGR